MADQRTTTLAAVLAGGAGRRVGGAKATVELAGRALIGYPLAALAAAQVEAVVVAKPDTELPTLTVPVVLEPAEPRHPLLGIVAALRHAGGRAVLVVACDLPLVPPALLAELAAAPHPPEEAPLLAAPGGDPQPLLGLYPAALLPQLESALAREEPLRRTVTALSPRLLEDAELARFGDPAEILLNVNDRADLERAGAILAAG